MRDFFSSLFHSFWNVLLSIQFIDILDILLLTYLINLVIKMVMETRAWQLLKGISLLIGAYLVSDFFGLRAISLITREMLSVGLLAIVILFQPELRRALERFGQSAHHFSRIAYIFKPEDLGELQTKSSEEESEIMPTELLKYFSNCEPGEKWAYTINVICKSVAKLSQSHTGALIVIERSTKLGTVADGGTLVHAVPTEQLFGNIFFVKTPLHDGAVIIRDAMIYAAACMLPLAQKHELVAKELGTRHRAAIGMSENSDALVVVVSEETGQISLAEHGELKRNLTPTQLRKELFSKMLIDENTQNDPFIKLKEKIPFLRKKHDSQKRTASAARKPDLDERGQDSE